ncbi:hypothetical protein HK102_008167 [Quaeritorhiza haematococci]|nr:hypothetical protein HK102_008167 [Quaeritorhiza haematococci]
MKIAIYARVSTQRQAEAQTIDEQIGRLREHARGRGWDLQEANVFRDDGYSGAALKRPGLDRLRDAAAMASFDAILLTDPDRLARNFVHQTLLLEELQSKGCRVEFLDRPMSRDPHDQLLLQIRGAVAEYERTLIAERTRRGRQRRYRAGEMLPWTRAPYGYRMAVDRPRDPSGVHLDPCEAAVVAEMFAWYSEGRRTLHGLVDHLRDLGVLSPSGKACWSDASVRGILRNPAYTGRVYAGRHRYREARARRSATHPIGRPHGTAEPTPRDEWIDVGPIPAVVDPGLFERVQAKLAANRSFSSRNNKVGSYLLRCLVSCGHCGLASIARRRPPHYGYYTCTGKSRAARNRNGATCGSRFIPAVVLDDLVWGDLCELLRDPAAAGGAFRRAAAGSWHPQEFQARRERLRQGKASLSGQLERLPAAYLGGVVPLEEYRRRRGEMESRRQTLAEQEARLAGESERLDEVVGMAATLESFCGRIAAGLETATFDGKRQLVELLVDRVVVTGDEVEIRYVLPTSDKSENVRFCHLRSDYLDHPSPRQYDEALLIFRLAHQLQDPAGEQPGPADRRLVGGVGPDEAQPGGPALQARQDELHAVAVLDARRVDHDRQEEAQSVDDVPLAAGRPLARVVAPHAPLGRADRLAVDDRRRRALLAAVGVPQAGPQDLHDPVPGPVEPPAAVVVVDRAPGGQVVGEHPPGDAPPDDVQHAVQDLAQVDRTRAAAGLGLRQQRPHQLPLLVGQVGGIVLAVHDRPEPRISGRATYFSHAF